MLEAGAVQAANGPCLYPGYEQDAAACLAILAKGSKSFAAAARLLPPDVLRAGASVYAFCREADDAVDLTHNAQSLQQLHARLEQIYTATELQSPVDRAVSSVFRYYRIPREVPEALLEGFAWDLEGRCYASMEELEEYCARVASTVGVMMTLVMGVRDRRVLARAAELGLAMQLTNIARDVGEDARAGRIYLPQEILQQSRVERATLSNEPRYSPAVAYATRRVLQHAEKYYAKSRDGIAYLPPSCRIAINAARLIYRDIGRVIANSDYNTIDRRAYTTTARKRALFVKAAGARFYRKKALQQECPAAVQFLLRSVLE